MHLLRELEQKCLLVLVVVVVVVGAGRQDKALPSTFPASAAGLETAVSADDHRFFPGWEERLPRMVRWELLLLVVHG